MIRNINTRQRALSDSSGSIVACECADLDSEGALVAVALSLAHTRSQDGPKKRKDLPVVPRKFLKRSLQTYENGSNLGKIHWAKRFVSFGRRPCDEPKVPPSRQR